MLPFVLCCLHGGESFSVPGSHYWSVHYVLYKITVKPLFKKNCILLCFLLCKFEVFSIMVWYLYILQSDYRHKSTICNHMDDLFLPFCPPPWIPSPVLTTSLVSVFWVFFFKFPYMRKMVQNLSFSVWLISLSIIL